MASEIKGTLAFYKSNVIEGYKKENGVTTMMAVPRLAKIVLNMGLGESKNNKNVLTDGLKALSTIAGQQAVATLSKRDVATFKIRTGVPIGAMVTLRGEKMWDFLARLINIGLPRVKDFKGVSKKSFDGKGNYSIGIADHGIFPELGNNASPLVKGLTVTICTTAKIDSEAHSMLKILGMPFVK